VIGCGVALVIAFAFLRPKPQPKEEADNRLSQSFIGEVVPYTPIRAQAAPAPLQAPPSPAQPTPVAAAIQLPPPPPPPRPPEPPVMRLPVSTPPSSAPAKPAKPERPAMISYAVPAHTESRQAMPDGNRDPAQTRIDFKTSVLPGAKASAAVDETYQLEPGLLPCVLDTAINSDLPGPLMCHLPGPVYSRKGVLLMEAGTQVIGRYESIARNGQNRLQAVSTYAHTPNGIWVPLAEPLADDLGRSGLDATIDHRYMERFGAATLLTLTESGLSVLQAALSKGGNTYLSLQSGSGGVGSLAQDILRQQSTIAPIGYRPQGSTMAIWITAPIDFSDSYRVRTRDAQR
jgi:type IV secretion system protein VirB10